MKQNMLITGATGFAGSNFLRLLAADPDAARFDLTRAARSTGDVDVSGDLSEHGVAERILRLFKPDVILHFAGRVPRNDMLVTDAAYERDNITATARLVAAAQTLATPPHIIFYSTAALYPSGGVAAGKDDLQTRSRFAAVDDMLPQDQISSAYGRSKCLAELSVATYSGPWTILRKPTVIGLNDQRGNFLQRLLLHIYEENVPAANNLQRAGDYIGLADVFNATMRILTTPAARGATLNIGAGRPITGFEAWHTMLSVADERGMDTRFAATTPAADMTKPFPGTLLDITAARKTIGYKPKTPFAELCRTIFDDVMERPTPRAYLRRILGLAPI